MPLLDPRHQADGRACILVATDFSDTSAQAIRAGAAIAEDPEVRLKVVHIVDMLEGQNLFDVFFESADALEEKVRVDASAKLRDFVAETLGESISSDVETEVRFGHPVDDLVGEAGHKDVVLLVLGTTGGGRLGNAIFGSTASRVLRETPVPVLMVSEDAPTRPARKILAPMDFSEPSRASLVAAANLARSNDGEVLVFNAMTSPPITPYYPAAPPPSTQLLNTLGEERNAKLTQLVAELEVNDVATILEVQHTEAIEDAILEAAEDHDVDLICMGSHGRKGLERFMLGSTAEKVLRAARRPVLVIK